MDIRAIVVGQLQANCYLVIDESTKAALVIDPGDDVEKIIGEIKAADADVKHILLTHGHFDHAFAVGKLQQSINADVRLHEADLVQLKGSSEVAEMFYDLSTYIEPRLGEFLQDEEVINFGASELRVLHTQGHSGGSVCFVSEGIAITGDTLFAGSIGRTDFPGGSMDDMKSSLTNKLLTLDNCTVIYPGHGRESTIGDERDDNPWLQDL